MSVELVKKEKTVFKTRDTEVTCVNFYTKPCPIRGRSFVTFVSKALDFKDGWRGGWGGRGSSTTQVVTLIWAHGGARFFWCCSSWSNLRLVATTPTLCLPNDLCRCRDSFCFCPHAGSSLCSFGRLLQPGAAWGGKKYNWDVREGYSWIHGGCLL